MTQEELANRAGCTRQTIIALEQGKYVPSIDLAFRIARAFGVSLEDVFQYEEGIPELNLLEAQRCFLFVKKISSILYTKPYPNPLQK
jgi:putative transcriptional regulator